ncbi:Ubiquitin family protein [Zea mays]|uniref:Ubiquitin family protein n=1 Tax=Zea mays TaxID=4577 RepID=A0A1D6QJ60_MAIZE|nr:Ubiquitin family protein [Zea mays]
MGNGAQGNSTSAIPQASVGGVSGVPLIAAQVANALANAPSQVSLSTQSAADQGFHLTTDNRADVLSSSTPATTPQNGPSGTSGSSLPSQDRNTLNVPSLDSIQQHPQLGDTCADTADLSGDATAISTHDAPSNPSVDSSVLKNKSSDEVGSQTTEPSASGSAEPLGLGGGLIPIPKRRSKAVKPSGSTTDPSRDLSSVSQNQDPISVAQQFLEGFASRNTNGSRSNTLSSGPPSSVPQATEVPPRRQGGGQPDIGSMISGMLNNPVFSNMLSNVATQAGGSSADLKSVMEGLQSPAIVDTISNIVQNVDEQDLGAMFGSGRGQGGMDLSRMLQQMMPVVSQALGGAGGRSAGANGGQHRSRPQRIDGEGNAPASSSQIDLHEARQSIEQHESPENIFRAVLETAAQAHGEDNSIQGMVEELATDQELADDYMKLLMEQVRQRIQSESQSGSQP